VRLANDGAWFGLLAVAPAMQGRGIASLLIAEAEAIAAREGAGTMRLECAEELGMPPYYASLGYEIESRTPGVRFNRNAVDITRIVMRKPLR
jgi:GNAT superfamily N-acetyltransferase